MAERRSNGGFRVHLRPQLCQQKTGEGKWSAMKVFSMSAFGALVLVLMGSSLTPQARFGENKWYLAFKSFSLQNTLPQLLASKPSSFKSIHGIRALSALALFMCHKAITQLFGPYTNANDLAHSMSHPWRIIGRTAFIYTDSFILLSVFLTASSYIASLQRDNTLGIRNRIVQRLFRILPNFMVVMVFSTYILPQLGSGPLWPLLVDQHAGLCKKYMWRNLLFIHNYFGFKNMCLTHTHQLAIDMQLFLFSPIIIYVVYSRRTLGWIFAIILAFISCILRAGAILKWKLSYVVYFGITISKMFETADYSYIMPTHRAGVYIIGICLAFVLRDGFGATFRNHKHATKIYTVITVTLGCYAVVGPYWMTKKFYKYNVGEAIAFGVLSPIFWSLAICFTLHAEKYNYGGWLVQLFGWNGFQFFSRISYSFYLMQFPVFFYNVAKRRHSSEYNPYILVETGETLVVVLLSTVLTLCVEIPFLNIYSIIFKGRRTKT